MPLSGQKRVDSPLCSIAEIRVLEQQLFKQTPSFSVMQQAGQVLFNTILRDYPSPMPNQTVHILLGSGNNAGDGLVLATLLKQAGFLPKGYWVFNQPIGGDAAKACVLAKKQGVELVPFAHFSCQDKDIIIEAILGIGLDRPLNDKARYAIQVINQNKQKYPTVKVYAVDVPVGLLADTGGRQHETVYADETVTFIADKVGLHTGNGPACVGKVTVATLGAETLPLFKKSTRQRYYYMPRPWCAKNNTHKGDYGHVLTVGGGQGMFGATALSAISALKVGSGKSSIYSHADYASQYHINKTPLYEIMRCVSLKDLSGYSAVVLGPGLGRDSWGIKTYQQTLVHLTDKTRLLLDADGLYHLAKTPSTSLPLTVITPHEAEAALLLQCSVEQIRADKPACVKALAKRYRCVAVLKGSGTLISDGSNLWINSSGNVNLATAGSGDVLAGMIGGYLSQNRPVVDSVLAAVYFHGLAADSYLKSKDNKSMRASDLWSFL